MIKYLDMVVNKTLIDYTYVLEGTIYVWGM